MEIETNRIINFKYNRKPFNKIFSKILFKKYFIKYLFIIIIFYFYYNFNSEQYKKIFDKISLKMRIMLNKSEKKLNLNLKTLKNNIELFNKRNKKETNLNIFNETNIFKKDLEEQNNFCNNQHIYINKKFDVNIRLAKVKFYNKEFNMYVYKTNDIVSNYIIKKHEWESYLTYNLLNALTYYSNKNHLSNNEIYIIDIGANIGWYTFILSKYKYNIISFEPSKMNYYILKKNYCINKGSNIILINKGLYNESKRCNLYNMRGNRGNGMIICNNNTIKTNHFINFIKTGEIILTKLQYYIPIIYKNLTLIKIDVEGLEGKVFEGGIELITKYHIPFIVLEFSIEGLKLHGTNPKEFLQIFLNNGYIISPFNFLNKNNYTVDYIIKKVKNSIMNLYFTYSKIFEK